MKGAILIFSIITISFYISINSSEELYDKFKEKTFLGKMKYVIIYFFNKIELFTEYILSLINAKQIIEPYDFFFFFIVGCIFRILYLILKNIYKSIFNLKDSYIYNEHDNTENLYKVINKLEDFKKNINNINNDNEEENKNKINNINNNINNKINNNINQNDLLKLTEIEKMNKNVNEQLEKIEECIKVIENNYNDEKANNEKILKIILNCQQFIKNDLEKNQKEEKH